MMSAHERCEQAVFDAKDNLIWNEAIEAAAKVIDRLNREGPYQSITGATKIRKLKR